MEYLDNIGKRAQAAKPDLQHLKSEEKNQILRKSADDLKLHATEILAANEKDMEKGRTNGMSQGLLDRLLLTEDRIAQIAEGLYQIAALDDPIGEVLGHETAAQRCFVSVRNVYPSGLSVLSMRPVQM